MIFFSQSERDRFTDIYAADTRNNHNETRKMRLRSGSAEIGYKKEMKAKQHPYIRTRLEQGLHYDNLRTGMANFLEDGHTHGAKAIRRIVKERRMLYAGTVKIAYTQLFSAELVLKGVNNDAPIVIALSHTPPYIDFETESPPETFSPDAAYAVIERSLDDKKVKPKKRQSISTRGVIAHHLGNFPPDHPLFADENDQAPLIIAQCLRLSLRETFTQKGLAGKWRG